MNEHPARPRLTRRQLAGVAFGNGFEFYDFTVYGLFAVPIGRTFFPSDDPLTSLLLSTAVFGIGFGARPLGALFFGAYADRHGRRSALVMTVWLMTLGTAGLVMVPGHAVLGSAAGLLVVACRLVQGFALGGEIGPSISYLAEMARPGRHARMVALPLAAHGGAVLAAALVGFGLSSILSPAALDAWGWRAALLPGLGAVPAALAIRAGLPAAAAAAESRGSFAPFAEVLGRPMAVVAGIGAILGGAVAFYVGAYLPSYAMAALGFPPAAGFAAGIASGATTVMFTLCGGALADRFGWRRILVAGRLALAAAAVPAFLLVDDIRSLPALLIAGGGLAALNGLPAAAALCAVTESMPSRARATGVAVVFALGVSLFGGATQFAVTALVRWSGDPLWPGYVLAAASLLAAAAAFGLPAGPSRQAERSARTA